MILYRNLCIASRLLRQVDGGYKAPKMFFDFLKFEADLDHQVKYFVNKARQHPAWAQQKIYSVYFRKIMQ